jgi:phosphoglycolate phosphatase
MPSRSRPAPPGGRWKGVVTDVDGTLTDRKRHLDPRAMRAVLRLEAAGIPVTLATGNVLPFALALHRFLGTSGPIVAENGAIVCRSVNGRPRLERLADRRLALRAYATLRRAGVPARRLFTDRWRECEVAIEQDVPLAAVRRAIRGLPVTAEATGYAIHLIERGVGKLPSLTHALASIGLAPSDCVILGDGDNDVAMLRAAGFSVSFPSASPRARRAARYLTRADASAGFEEGLKASGILA